MFLKKLRGDQYGFFDLFERHAETTREAAANLVKVCNDLTNAAIPIAKVEELEHSCDSMVHMVVDLLHKSFITPLDRDEILELISKLDDVMDLIDHACKTMQLYVVKVLPPKLKEMVDILAKAQERVCEAVKMLRTFKNTDQLRAILKEIHSFENEGDSCNHAGISALFRENESNPLYVIKIKAIFETVEEAIDKCEDIADAVESIVLEHF